MTHPAPEPEPEPGVVRVALPAHLRRLAGTGSEVSVEVGAEPTLRAVLDALEAAHPALLGTIRDRATGQRRAYMRFFVCGEDVSLAPQEQQLPVAIVEGREPIRVVGAIAGG